MDIQGRKYYLKDNSILLKEYEDVDKIPRYNKDINFQNSLGSNAFQSSSKFPPNQENNNSNNFNMNSNINYPTQNFDNTYNPMNGSNGFSVNQKNFAKTDLNQNINGNSAQIDEKQYYNTNSQIPNQNYVLQLTKESRIQLEKEVENIYDYYYMTKGYFQNDPEQLFEFYLEFKKKYQNGKRVPSRIGPLMLYKDDDVEKCIQDFLMHVKDRFKLSNASTDLNTKCKRSMSMKKGFTTNIKNAYINKISEKELINRLYVNPKPEQKILNCENFDKFFEKLVLSYYKKNNKFTNRKNLLIDYYKSLPNKEENNMEWENGEKDFIENIELFFTDEEIVARLSEIYYKHNHLWTYHPTILHNYWQHNMKRVDKYTKGLYKYGKDQFYLVLQQIYQQKEDQRKFDRDNQEEEEKNRRIQEEIDYKNHIRETQEERERKINELAKPKDKYKTGRVMLGLKDQFKYDNIIKKMIKNEFKDNKLFKFPEEYAIRDEEEQKDTLFKLNLNKEIKKDPNNDKIKEQIEEAYDKYEEKKRNDEPIKQKKQMEKKALFDFIKNKVKEYYKNMAKRLIKDENGIESINLFLNNVYKEMSKKYKNATRLYFKHPRCEVLKKTYKYKKIHTYYPKKLKFYFFRLLRRIGTDEKGNIVFAKNENIPFWSPSLSNKCKIHGNNCPIYCCYNTHNDMIKESREKNFNSNFNIKKCKKKLEEKENLNLWKRPELQKQKQQIFMCFDDAEHCTFEPKLSKTAYQLEKDALIESRLNNDKWVNEMGKNFTTVRGTIYKEGILKKAKVLFSEGKYDDTIKLLEKAFDLNVFKAYKPKFLLSEGETNQLSQLNKKPEEKKEEDKEGEKKEEKKEGEQKEGEKKEEEKKEGEKKEENKKEDKPNNIVMPGFRKNIDLSKPTENFKNEKNTQLLDEIYFMLETIKEYKKRQKLQSKKLKEELNLIEHEKGLSGKKIIKSKEIDSKEKYDPQKNIQYNLMKQKYFNIKDTMCKDGDNCPYYLKGEDCPNGAHQISELKFKSQIRENIKLRKNLIKTLDKAPEPVIKKPWVHTGQLCDCGLADGSAGGKCICGFCKYKNFNNPKEKELRKNAKKKNEKILKNREKRSKKEKEEKIGIKK